MSTTLSGNVLVRAATEVDLPAINAIYNHYIVHTPATFDIEPWSIEQRVEWFARYGDEGPHRVLVAVRGGEVAGLSWSSPFRPKRAYDTTIETSVYCAPGSEGQGVGTVLYRALFDALAGQGLHRAIAAITQPNEPSNALHTRSGFHVVGVTHEVGWKFGRYWDVRWAEKEL